MIHPKTIAALLPVVALIGCSNPADSVPKANVSSSTNAAAEVAAKSSDADGRFYAFGPDASSVEFVGSKVTGSHKGGFRKFAGELHAVNGRLADSGQKVVIDIGSIYTDTDRLTGHLKSPDFFNAAQFPTATFVTASISQQGTNSLVTGDLTLHGITRKISFPAKIDVADNSIDLAADFAINRFDFEIKYPGKANDLIRKEVVLKLRIKAAPGKADFKSIEPQKQVGISKSDKPV
jgi:polyisoprenoid-binding protein YceI